MKEQERRERLEAVLTAIHEAFTLPKVGGARMAGRAAFANLVHLRDLFDGVLLLLERAKAHGALVLGRSMFETSLMLGAMEDPTTRDAVVLRWFQDSNSRTRGLGRALAAADVATDLEEYERRLHGSNRELAAARSELGVGRLPPALIPENEARRQGREEDLANYLTAHEFTHGGYQALRFRITHHAGEARSTFHLEQAHNFDLLEAAANFAGRSALLGFRSGCRIFEVPEPESLPRLLELIEFQDATDVERVE
jgi:hypothetical protein